jgi:hypothetical protein
MSYPSMNSQSSPAIFLQITHIHLSKFITLRAKYDLRLEVIDSR